MTAEQVKLSVIFPVVFSRNQALYSLRKWSVEQSFPRGQYEIIILLLKQESAILSELKQYIMPHDQVIICDDKINMMDMYAQGVEAAKGEWVFLCEAHSAGEVDCLQNAYNHVTANQLDGAGCKSVGIISNAFAQMEENMYAKAAAVRLQPEHYSKLFLRGAILKRECYFAGGGFQSQYGLFSEPVLAMNLHKKGYKLGYAKDAVVNHFNTTNPHELSVCIADYAQGEAQFFHQNPQVFAERYFDKPDHWQELGWLDPRSVKYFWKAIGKSLLSNDRTWLQRFNSWLSLLPQMLIGTKWNAFKLKTVVILNGAACWLLSWNKTYLWDVYQTFHAAVVKKTQINYLINATNSANYTLSPINTFEHNAAHLWPNEALWGFYPTETFGNHTFRWTKPEALMKLFLKPNDYHLTFTIPPYRQIDSLHVYLNGKKISDWKFISATELQIPIRKNDCHASNHQYLVMSSPSLRPSSQKDERKLGIPISFLKIAALS